MLSRSTSHPMLLPISLHFAMSLRSICPLLRSVRHDTLVIKLRLVVRSEADHNHPPRNSITNNTKDTGQGDLTDSFLHISSNHLPVHIDLLSTHPAKNRLLQYNIYENGTGEPTRTSESKQESHHQCV